MPISFSHIPSDLKIPLYWVEVDPSMAGLPVLYQPALIVGTMIAPTKGVTTAAVAAGGSGYLVNDTISLLHGVHLKVTAVGTGPTTPTTGASGTGTTATLTFAAMGTPFPVGSQITVAGMTPSAYNGSYTVTASTTTSVSYASTATGAQTVAGTVALSGAITTVQITSAGAIPANTAPPTNPVAQ